MDKIMEAEKGLNLQESSIQPIDLEKSMEDENSPNSVENSDKVKDWKKK